MYQIFHVANSSLWFQDGTLRLIDIKSNDCRVIEQCNIGVPITSFSFSPSYRHIALGSSRVGCVHNARLPFKPHFYTAKLKGLKRIHVHAIYVFSQNKKISQF